MHRRLFPTLTMALALVLMTALAAGAAPRKTYKVHNIDVGQGSATLVQTLGGKNILFDTGWDFAGDRLVSYLKQIKVKRLDALVISHRHMDHIGGVRKLSDAVTVKKVIGPWAKDGIPETAMVHLANLRKSHRSPHSPRNRPAYETAVSGKTFDMGHGFTMETLWPKVHTSRKRIGDYNQESVTMRVVQNAPNGKGASFMFGGDLGVKEERWLARKMPQKLKCDWIVANHHGSGGSSQREYMAAQDGGYSRMLKALIDGPGTRDQRVYQVANKLKEQGRGRLAGTIMRQLDPLNKNPKPIRAKWLKKLIKDIKDLDASQPHMKGRFAVYSVGPNAYGHPNATRMSESMLAGFTPITTWANGTVVMTRKVGTDGGWAADWKPVASSSRALPRVRTPGWLGKRDPEKPYNDVRREANNHWSKKNPHREVPWNAPWDVSKTWRTTSREFSQGRKDWVEQYVAAKSQANSGVKDGREPRTKAEKSRNIAAGKRKLKSMQHNVKREWHGLKLDNMKELTKVQLKHIALKADGRYTRRGHASSVGSSSTMDPIAVASVRGHHARTTAKRTTAKRTTAKRTTAKRTTAKRTTAKRTTAKRTTAKRTTAKRTKRTTKGSGSRWSKLASSTTRARATTKKPRTRAKTTSTRTRAKTSTAKRKRTSTTRPRATTKSKTPRRRSITKSKSSTTRPRATAKSKTPRRRSTTKSKSRTTRRRSTTSNRSRTSNRRVASSSRRSNSRRSR